MKPVKKPVEKNQNKKMKTKSKPKPGKSAKDKMDDMQRLVHLLQVNQIELEHQTQELRIIQNELEVSRNNYVQFFDFSPIPYFSMDSNGIIKEVNLKASQLVGEGRNKLTGKRIISVIVPEDQKTFQSFIKFVFESGFQQTCELKMMGKNKSILRVKLEGILLTDTLDANPKCLIAFIPDSF
jgi:PAS domain-containing protein